MLRFAFVFLFAITAATAAETAITDIGNDDVIAWLAIPDLKQALKDVQAAAGTVGAPTELDIPTMVGAQLGDPELAQLRDGAPLAVMVMRPKKAGGNPIVVGFVPVNDGAAYQNLAAAGKLQASIEQNVLIIGKTPDALELGTKALPNYQSLSAMKVDGALRLHVSISKILAVWGPMLRIGMDSFANMAALGGARNGMDTTALVGLVTAELHGILVGLQQCEQVQLDIGCNAERVTIHHLIQAKTGTSLATALSAPTTESQPSGLLSAPAGGFAVVGRVNAAGMNALVADMLKEISATPSTKDLISEATAKMITDGLAALDGSMAVSVQMKDDAMHVESATGLTDAAQGEKVLALMSGLYAADGPFGSLFENIGLKVELQRSTRKHSGIDVNHLKMTVDPDKGQQAAAMKQFVSDQELAVAKNWYLAASDAAGLDGLLDRVTGATPIVPGTTQAEKEHGPGAHLYVDYDVFAFMRLGLRNVFGNAALPEVTPTPVTWSAIFDKGTARTQTRVPLKPIGEFVKMMQEMHNPAPQQDPNEGAL